MNKRNLHKMIQFCMGISAKCEKTLLWEVNAAGISAWWLKIFIIWENEEILSSPSPENFW